MLHIANTDSTAGNLRLVSVPGEVIAWNDELYEGPVPAGFSHEALSKRREEFLVSSGRELRDGFLRRYSDRRLKHGYEEIILAKGWWSSDEARRDRVLQTACDHSEIVLWFAHDLNEQLRLIQVLAWFAEYDRECSRLKLVQSPDHLGSMTTDHGRVWLPKRLPRSRTESELGRGHRETPRKEALQVEIRRTQKSWHTWGTALTDAGRSVLEGETDAIELRGIDRWLGGVHLHGHQVSWRWNKEDLRLETVGSD